MNNIHLIVSHMRNQQARWSDEPEMRKMTVQEMMSLERWLQVAESAPEFVLVGVSS